MQSGSFVEHVRQIGRAGEVLQFRLLSSSGYLLERDLLIPEESWRVLVWGAYDRDEV